MNARYRQRDPRSWTRPTIAFVDLDAITANLARVRAALGAGVGVMAVLKADAYGHGAAHAGQVLAQAGVNHFAVAIIEEGAELRRAGIGGTILVLGGMIGEDDSAYRHFKLTPVVYRPGQIRALHRGGPIDAHIKLDTGMNRVGAREPDVAALLAALKDSPNVRVAGIASHFADADFGPTDPLNATQLQRFGAQLERFRAAGHKPRHIHMANSAAALALPAANMNMARVGLALYGLDPLPAGTHATQLEPALSLRTQIVHVKSLAAGEGLSYGHTFKTTRPSRIATLPIGYADGYPRLLSNRAEVLIAGRRAPLAGNVCMDLCLVDVTGAERAAGREFEAGEDVVLIGKDGGDEITAHELARHAETISYEIVTRLSPRIPRFYSDETAAHATMMMSLAADPFEPGC